MSFYSQYRGRGIGRILHFLEHYCGLHVAEHVCIGGNAVTLGNYQLASIAWSDSFGEGDVPEFTFAPCNTTYVYQQRTKRRWALLDGCAMAAPTERTSVDSHVLRVILPDATHRAALYASIVHQGAEPSFFASGEKLFAEMPGELYAWDKECGWLLWWVKDKYAAMEKARMEAMEQL